MKIDKKKLIFSILVCVLLIIIAILSYLWFVYANSDEYKVLTFRNNSFVICKALEEKYKDNPELEKTDPLKPWCDTINNRSSVNNSQKPSCSVDYLNSIEFFDDKITYKNRHIADGWTQREPVFEDSTCSTNFADIIANKLIEMKLIESKDEIYEFILLNKNIYSIINSTSLFKYDIETQKLTKILDVSKFNMNYISAINKLDSYLYIAINLPDTGCESDKGCADLIANIKKACKNGKLGLWRYSYENNRYVLKEIAKNSACK